MATKVGSRLGRFGRRVRDFTSDGIERSVEESLVRLRTTHVYLLQLHGPPLSVLQDDAVIHKLQTLKEQGIISRLGVSGDGAIAEHSASMSVFDCIMTTANVVERENLRAVEQARCTGKGVLIKSPMAHAVFSPSLFKPRRLSDIWYLMRLAKNYRGVLAQRRKYLFLNEVSEWTGAQLALKYVLSVPGVSCAVIGTTNIKHLTENLAVCKKQGIPREILDKILRSNSIPKLD